MWRIAAVLTALLACSSARTDTSCFASVAGAGNFQIGCTAHEIVDPQIGWDRAWSVEFPDGGPIYTLTGDQLVGTLYFYAGGDGGGELRLPSTFRPPDLRTLGSGFIRDPDGGLFMLSLPQGDAGPLGDATLILTGEIALPEDAGRPDISTRAFRGTLAATFVRQLIDGGPGTDTAHLNVSF
jgi:hypothetical protein